MHLTKEERLRFAEWLENEAHTERGLVEQMKKLPIGSAITTMLEIREADAAACDRIARKLRSIEEQRL